MKIICIEGNYTSTIQVCKKRQTRMLSITDSKSLCNLQTNQESVYFNKEKKKDNCAEPVFFLKPETSILRNNQPFFIPDHTQKVIPRVNIVLKICRLGKNIQEKFAHLYYDEIGIGVDMEAADVIEKCIKNGLPWETAKAYDSSSPLGYFIPKNEFEDISNISFSLWRNSKIHTRTNTSGMIYSFDEIIAYVSKYVMLKTGDYIFTGSPETDESVNINDHIECFILDNKALFFNVK